MAPLAEDGRGRGGGRRGTPVDLREIILSDCRRAPRACSPHVNGFWEGAVRFREALSSDHGPRPCHVRIGWIVSTLPYRATRRAPRPDAPLSLQVGLVPASPFNLPASTAATAAAAATAAHRLESLSLSLSLSLFLSLSLSFRRSLRRSQAPLSLSLSLSGLLLVRSSPSLSLSLVPRGK